MCYKLRCSNVRIKAKVKFGKAWTCCAHAVHRIETEVFGSFIMDLIVSFRCYSRMASWATFGTHEGFKSNQSGTWSVRSRGIRRRRKSFQNQKLEYVSRDRIMKLLIGCSDNRTWNDSVHVHVAALRKGHEKTPALPNVSNKARKISTIGFFLRKFSTRKKPIRWAKTIS